MQDRCFFWWGSRNTWIIIILLMCFCIRIYFFNALLFGVLLVSDCNAEVMNADAVLGWRAVLAPPDRERERAALRAVLGFDRSSAGPTAAAAADAHARLATVLRAVPASVRVTLPIVHAAIAANDADVAALVRRLLEWDAAFWHLREPPMADPQRAAAGAAVAVWLRRGGEYDRMLEALARCLRDLLASYAVAFPRHNRLVTLTATAALAAYPDDPNKGAGRRRGRRATNPAHLRRASTTERADRTERIVRVVRALQRVPALPSAPLRSWRRKATAAEEDASSSADRSSKSVEVRRQCQPWR